MAKKVLTPEEVQAKMEKKAAKRNLFFGTFTKALAFFLAIAIAWSLAAIAFTPAVTGTVASSSTQTGTSTDDGNDDDVDFGGNSGDSSSSSSSGDSSSSSNSGDSSSSSSSSSTSTGVAKADVVKALNDATAKAYKGSYTWERKCYYTKDIDVGNATETLNGIIQGVDENATLGSVVGNFLGITGGENDPAWTAEVVNGARPTENTKMNKDKYLMKAFALEEGDIKQYKVDGNTYMVQLNACNNPQKDGGNALHHVTDDFITLTEVQEGVAEALGSAASALKVESCDVDYKAILVTAVIENGSLKSVEISYTMNVNALNLKAAVLPITGTGAGKMICTYKNFK